MAELEIDSNTIVQSGCTLYSCTIGENVFVGSNSVILEGAKIENNAIILPNSVVPPGRLIPAQQVWGGNPIKYIRNAKDQEKFVTKTLVDEIKAKNSEYNYQFLPYNNAYLYKETDPSDEKVEAHHFVNQDLKLIKTSQYRQDNPTEN